MNLQTVPQTSGNNWSPSFSDQRAYQPERRPLAGPHIESQCSTFFASIEKDMSDARASQEAIMKELRARFGMASDALVVTFLASHRSIPHLLTEAFDRLRVAFGAGVAVNLEVMTDEDGNQTLYVTTLWANSAQQAATAFHSFVETWWIHRMNAANSDVAFVYQLI